MEGIFYSGRQVAETTLPQVGFLVPQIVPKEGIVLIYGKYGSYKTPLALNLAKAIASGSRIWGLQSEAARALVIEADMPKSGIWPRLQNLGTDVDDLDFVFCYPGWDVVNPTVGTQNAQICRLLKRKHADHSYGVVVVDSLRVSHAMSAKDPETPPMVYRSMAALFPGAVVVIVHHDRKTRVEHQGSRRWGKSVEELEMEEESFSGSQAWADLATTTLKVSKGRGKDDGWIVVSQPKSQVGTKLAEPLYLKAGEDAVTLSVAPKIDIESGVMERAIHSVMLPRKIKSYPALDTALAGWFHVSEGQVKSARQQWEGANGRISF